MMAAGSRAIPRRVLLVAPTPPPYGGMALQARLLEKQLRRDGIEVTFFPANLPFPPNLQFMRRIRGARTIVRILRIWLRLWREVREVEVVHVLAASWVYFFGVVVPAVVVGRIRGKRLVLNYRGGEAERFFRQWGWAARPVFKLSHVVTTPSEFLADVIRRHFRIPVRIVPNILDLGAFVHRSRQSFQPKMLVTRHLEPIYDVESVLLAFRRVQECYPEASLWIAGTGSQQERLQSLASDWGLANIRFLGHIPHADLPRIYDQCDILLNASRVDNFPGALIEASGAGLAVVSTGAGGIPYIYENGRTALLVDPGDWQGLARAVQKVLEFPSLASDMVRAAEVMARACDWKEVRKQLYKAYGFAVEDQPNAAGEGVSCAVG